MCAAGSRHRILISNHNHSSNVGETEMASSPPANPTASTTQPTQQQREGGERRRGREGARGGVDISIHSWSGRHPGSTANANRNESLAKIAFVTSTSLHVLNAAAGAAVRGRRPPANPELPHQSCSAFCFQWRKDAEAPKVRLVSKLGRLPASASGIQATHASSARNGVLE